MTTYSSVIEAKEAAQAGANACGQRVYFYRTPTGRWEVSLELHPLWSTNQFNYCTPQAPAKDDE